MFPGVHVRTRLVHACSPACVSAQSPCTHVPRRACSHKARARMFPGVHACTRLVHACSPACMSAQGSCTHVLRRARQHEAHARMQSGVLACTPEVPARREFERYAEESFWPAPTPGKRHESVVLLLFNFLVDNRLLRVYSAPVLLWNNYRTTSIKTCTNAFTRQR